MAENQGTEAHIIDNASQLDSAWLKGKKRVGVTAGTSAPEVLVTGVTG